MHKKYLEETKGKIMELLLASSEEFYRECQEFCKSIVNKIKLI